jgi:hypothetical protein
MQRQSWYDRCLSSRVARWQTLFDTVNSASNVAPLGVMQVFCLLHGQDAD